MIAERYCSRTISDSRRKSPNSRKSPPGDDKAIIGINVTFSAYQSITNQWKQSDYENLTELCPPRGNPSPFPKSDNGGYHANGDYLSFREQ